MIDERPGLNPYRMIRLMHEAIQRCELDLRGAIVLTEAASGAYVVTPILAAMAGSKQVFAITKTTRYGTIEQVSEHTLRLAHIAGIDSRISLQSQVSKDIIAQADIITNSGHLRPLDTRKIKWMKPTAVIPLMYEAWEFRSQDIDLDACKRKGILVAGTNERHSAIDVFSFLGIMAIKLLTDAGISVYESKILVLCNNPFSPFIKTGLQQAGAKVDTLNNLSSVDYEKKYDAILVAYTPTLQSVFTREDATNISRFFRGAVIVQFWGNIDREVLYNFEIPLWPTEEPLPGHMGVLPSEIGPEPIVRLQTGGLKVAELLWRSRFDSLSPSNTPMPISLFNFGEVIE